MKVILVTIGNYQEYILDNIQQLLLFNNDDITVITNQEYFQYFEGYPITLIDCNELYDHNFNENSQLDRVFRNRFMHYCSLRLFYVYSYIKKYNLKNCIHLENDVMTYIQFDKIEFKENKVYAPFHNDILVIPGFVFIPNDKAFEPIIDQYDVCKNDMENLSKFDESVLLPLPVFPNIDPIIKYNKLYDEFNMIFDGAAMGQYLGGIDPRNDGDKSPGYVNDSCIYKYNIYQFEWINENNLWIPYLVIDSKYYRICNLHIHCKNLKKFMSNQ